MNSIPTAASVMTGFVLADGSLYAIFKEPSGETQLYDRQAVAWLVSEARKTGAQAPNFEHALQVLTTVNIC